MKKMLIAVLTLLLTATLLTTTATAQEKITGPWLWMIAPTEPGLGGAASIAIDSLAVASGGAVTEAAIAANGARAGDRVGNYVWTFGEISATGWDNINECLNRIGMTNGNVDNHSSYALFQFQADTAQRGVTMHVGSDDAIKVWLNGTVVHNHPVNRGASDFQDTFPVNVVAGENLLLVKVSERGGGWSMFVGMDTADAPVRGPDAPVRGPVEVMSIPDANLAAAIRETLGLPTDAVITADAMLDLTWLEAPGKGITDLTGLEYATNLRVLVLHAARIDSEFLTNPISDISPLSALSQLEGLGIGNTPVSDISPLSALSQLKTLSLDYTDVSDISPLSALSQLTRLGLINTAVSDISPLSALSQLTWLSLANTDVSDISPLSALTQLVELNLSDCPLNADAYQTHIPAIQANGTEVAFDPIRPIHLPRVPSLVSLIYFRPSDRPVRPNVDEEIDGLIKKAQRFFADQLERHGFGRKTFQFETDAHGNAVVHHVNGKFPNAHYQQNYDSWKDEIREQIYIPRRSITAYMLDSDPDGRSFTEFGGYGGGSPYSGGSAAIDSQLWDWVTIAHELGHAFGMNYHDHRDLSLMSYQGFDGSLSPCFAAWLDVHPAFNPTVVQRGTHATIQMLPATLAAPPNTIRLRFTVTAPAGSLYQARLLTPEKNVRHGYDFNTGGLIGCKRIDGNPTSSTVEFVTTALTPDTESVSLQIIGINGGGIDSERFPIDVASLLPPAKVVSIPDPNLAAAVREALELSVSEAITTHSILYLVKLEARNRGIKSLTGLEHAVNLEELNLSGEYISGGGYVNSNAISDWSPLAALPQLEVELDGISVVPSLLPPAKVVSLPDPNLAAAVRGALKLSVSEAITTHSILYLVKLEARNRGIKSLTGLEHAVNLEEVDLSGEYISGEGDVNSNVISDWSPLANLPQLTTLYLHGSAVSDVSPLANLTNLETLDLSRTAVSDVSPLAGLSQLTWLYLNDTAVSDVSPLAALTQLTWLGLEHTAVSDVSPLAGLTQLTWLSLERTAVSDVSPLAGLPQLTWLELNDTAVSDVSPLAALTQLTELRLSYTAVSDVSPLAALTQLTELNLTGTGVSDVSPLANLTQLSYLNLTGTGVSDVSPLANLTQLPYLNLTGTGVSDVSPLAGLTQLTRLDLWYTAVSDVSPLLGLNLTGTSWDSIGLRLQNCPLSYASLHTHIPAMQAKGIEIEFDNVAHPALLKTSGDSQEGAPAATLKTPFVVEAMDAHGKPMVGVPIQFEIRHGGGTLSAQTATTDAQGKAQITLTLGRASGINKVKASSEGIQSYVLFTAVGTGAAPQLVADVNGDGVVDLADLAIVAQAMGKPVQNPRADVNADGVVDGEDFALIAANLGEGEAAAPSHAALPARLTLEKVEWALNLLHAENTGSPAFRRGIAKLEGFLALLVPDKTVLLANYPNPFNPETWIPYQLANPAEVTVTIYAANGAVVRKLDLGHQRAGSYASRHRAAYWDGRNEIGERVASGVYFYTLSAGDFAATRKMLILK